MADPCRGARMAAIRFAYRALGFPLAAGGRVYLTRRVLKEYRETSPAALRYMDWRQYRDDRADVRSVVCVDIDRQ